MTNDLPPTRRVTDVPLDDFKLIVYQLGELRSAVEKGFEKVSGKIDTLEIRIARLEHYRERVEEREKAAAASAALIDRRWVPIAVAMLTVVVLVVFGILSLTSAH